MSPTLFEHTRLECQHAVRVHRHEARRLVPFDPVPGCACARCVLLASDRQPGLDRAAFDVTLHQVLPALAGRIPTERAALAERLKAEWLHAAMLELPPIYMLVELAGRLPGARKTPWPHTDDCDPLPVEAARARPILEVCNELGLDLRRVGGSWRGPCPIHRGDGPNFSVDPMRRKFKCFVCGAKGDGIELMMLVRGVGFIEAVRCLAE